MRGAATFRGGGLSRKRNFDCVIDHVGSSILGESPRYWPRMAWMSAISQSPTGSARVCPLGRTSRNHLCTCNQVSLAAWPVGTFSVIFGGLARGSLAAAYRYSSCGERARSLTTNHGLSSSSILARSETASCFGSRPQFGLTILNFTR